MEAQEVEITEVAVTLQAEGITEAETLQEAIQAMEDIAATVVMAMLEIRKAEETMEMLGIGGAEEGPEKEEGAPITRAAAKLFRLAEIMA